MSIITHLEFDAEGWNDMPPQERVRRCQQPAIRRLS
jgi:hypothetical protein